MRYMGSKKKIAKHILSIMLENRKPGQYWVEPFVGGANVIDKVDNPRIGCDNNHYLIDLLQEMQLGSLFRPSFVDEDFYNFVKANKDYFEPWLTGYVGFNFSFGSKFFRGYRREKKGYGGLDNEEYQNATILKSLRAQQPFLKGIEFVCSDYRDLSVPPNSIIYCDPPYKNTTSYSLEFDHDEFYRWCSDMSRAGHQVFVSEYYIPECLTDFTCVWEKEVSSNLDVSSKRKREKERLYKCSVGPLCGS